MTDQMKGYLAVGSAATILGCQSTMNKLLIMDGLDPIVIAIIKMLFTIIAVFFILQLTKPQALQVGREDWLYFLLYGIITVGGFQFSYMNALHLTNVVTTTVLMYTAPVFVVVISALFMKEKLTVRKVAAIAITVLGCYFVAGGNQPGQLVGNGKGILFGLATGLCYSLWIILGKRLLEKYSPWTVVLYGNAVGMVSLFAFRSPLWIVRTGVKPIHLLYLFLIAMLTMVIGYTLYYFGLSLIESSKASVISNLEPVISVLVAYLVLKEMLTISKFCGFILIMLSIYIILYEDIAKAKSQIKTVTG